MALSLAETSDGSGSVFEPDVVASGQFYGPDERGLYGAERKLMAALLSDGVESYISAVSTAGNETEQMREAKTWIETSDPDYLFSFDTVCACLGIDAQYLRLGLRRYSTTLIQGGASDRAENGENMSPGLRVWKRIRRPRR